MKSLFHHYESLRLWRKSFDNPETLINRVFYWNFDRLKLSPMIVKDVVGKRIFYVYHNPIHFHLKFCDILDSIKCRTVPEDYY